MHPATHRLFRDPLFIALLYLIIIIASAALFFVSYLYAVYAMLTLLCFVSIVGAFAIIERDTPRLIAFFTIYVILVAPFIVVYARSATRTDFMSTAFYAGIIPAILLEAVVVLDEILLGRSFFKLFQLTKRFLNSRELRYCFSLSSVVVFAAGLTALSFILPSHALALFSVIILFQIATNMVENVYARRREIFSLATLGLNPDHFSGLLFAEALIIGFFGGGVGYATGLYFLLAASLPITTFEISTGWMVTVILLSVVTAVLSAALPAVKASMLATPSLLKSWLREAPAFIGWPPTWELKLPVKVTEENVEGFMHFFLDDARMLEGAYGSIERVEEVRFVRPEGSGEGTWQLRFRYVYNELSTPMIVTENELRTGRDPSGELTAICSIRVIDHRNVPDIYKLLQRIASTYRRLSLEWSEYGTYPH